MIRLLFLLLFLSSCATRPSTPKENTLLSIQLLDRNGFAETMSTKERLSLYEQTDFLAPQPYQKVIRVFGRDREGRIHSKITSYHPNGLIWQYLENVDGRAHGIYKEWHQNGQLKIQAHVIEGLPDINELSQTSWIFDQESSVFDEEGNLIATIPYDKGLLHGDSIYRYASGALWKKMPYKQGELHGELLIYDKEGVIIGKESYVKGQQEGLATAFYQGAPLFEEEYSAGKLFQARYFSPEGGVLSTIQNGYGIRSDYGEGHLIAQIEYRKGVPEGEIKIFSLGNTLEHTYQIRDDKKHGEELFYYPNGNKKLLISWHEDKIQGVVTSWYDNGAQESQKEMHANKKHGLYFGWYRDGSLMFHEEYDEDLLVTGAYYNKKDSSTTVSKVNNGTGTATLYDADGFLIARVNYEKGKPLLH